MEGKSLEVVKCSGGWRGSGFRSYVGVEMGRAFRTPRALIALSDSDSSDAGGLPREVKSDKKRRRKWRHTHAKAPSATPSASETSSAKGALKFNGRLYIGRSEAVPSESEVSSA